MTDVREAAPAAKENRAQSNASFIWYELLTSDIAGAKAFYDSVVGWDIQDRSDFPNDYRMIGRSDGKFAGGAMQITDEMKGHGARPTWLAYLYSEDVDRQAGDIERAGGKILMGSFDIPGVGRVAMVADPSGAPFYIMKPIPPAGDPDAQSDVFSPTEQQRVGWNELQTEDVNGARRYYEEQFGFDSSEFMDMGEMGEYRFFEQNGTRIGALFDAANGQPSHWRFYFRVPSVSAAKQAAEAQGGTIHMGPHQVPTGDYVIVGSDPQGAEFALVGGQ